MTAPVDRPLAIQANGRQVARMNLAFCGLAVLRQGNITAFFYDLLPRGREHPLDVAGHMRWRLARSVHEHGPSDGIGLVQSGFNARVNRGFASFFGNVDNLDSLSGVAESAVAEGILGFGNQIDNVFGAVHVTRTELEVGFFANNDFTEIVVSSGVVLAADANDVVAVFGHLDAEIGPLVDLAPFAIDFSELFHGDFGDGIAGVDVDG